MAKKNNRSMLAVQSSIGTETLSRSNNFDCFDFLHFAGVLPVGCVPLLDLFCFVLYVNYCKFPFCLVVC